MSLILRSFAVSAGVGLAVAAGYAVYKTGVLRPAAVKAVRGGMKAREWTEKKYVEAKKKTKEIIKEAKAKKPAAAGA